MEGLLRRCSGLPLRKAAGKNSSMASFRSAPREARILLDTREGRLGLKTQTLDEVTAGLASLWPTSRAGIWTSTPTDTAIGQRGGRLGRAGLHNDYNVIGAEG
jgi:hypothetical protein